MKGGVLCLLFILRRYITGRGYMIGHERAAAGGMVSRFSHGTVRKCGEWLEQSIEIAIDLTSE